ncbi:MAG: alpha/beta hydrolase [Pseudobutyrivibrio sp.]|nr:alpha/beta hydrolase [Pseudobutyrivibrio sp.]
MLIFLIIMGLLIIAFFAAGIVLMNVMTKPKNKETYEFSIDREKKNGLWFDFDDWDREEVNLTMSDGYVLHGLYIPGTVPDKFVIITHGYTANMYGMVKYAHIYRDLGYGIYIYDIRNHGKNKECYTSMGRIESRDIVEIARKLREKFGPDISIGLHGESLGAASSLLAIGIDKTFDFCVADCPFTDLGILSQEILGGGSTAKMLTFAMSMASVIFHGYRLDRVRPIDVVAGDLDVPICFIHGQADDFINCNHSRRAADQCRAYHEIHLAPGAGHAQSYEVLSDRYDTIVKEFLDRNNNCF